MLVFEHHLEVIFEFVARVIVLHQGEIIMDGSPEDVRQDARVQELYFGVDGAVEAGVQAPVQE